MAFARRAVAAMPRSGAQAAAGAWVAAKHAVGPDLANSDSRAPGGRGASSPRRRERGCASAHRSASRLAAPHLLALHALHAPSPRAAARRWKSDKVPITVARGDGIGPEIMDATLRILEVGWAVQRQRPPAT